ncbi:hypothetical protein HUT19_32190 [Streptomyces sp. NA02950]|uniref:hypothetical protein n=1 Tax=Streptomyces sp. NA02950 TaxID=2742137 RepID=UPI00158FF870|nr:hypothetical protein [Streptomyces sp. NA02950]QKV95828.1 hypothetical protein HUT19_32190 [Streptomyces sp. NA02950]
MADRSLEHSGPPPQAERRVVNPTLITPGPQPVEAAGPGADEVPQVLRGEVVGPRHARRRPADNRRKAAAGAILLSATGAATALFLLMGKDARQPAAAPDTSSAAPDRPDAHTASLGESAVGDAPLRGSRAPAPTAPAAADRAAAPPSGGSGQSGTGSSPSGQDHSATARQDRPSREPGRSGDWQDEAEQLRRWARAYAERHDDASGQGQGGQGHGQHRYDGGPGGGNGQGQGNGHGGPGHWGGGHRR